MDQLRFGMVPLSHIIQQWADKKPLAIALITETSRISYDELAQAMNHVAAYFEQHNAHEKRIILHLPNCPELIYAYLGCLKSGNIAVPLSTGLKQSEIEVILQKTEADYLITHCDYAEELYKIDWKKTLVKHIIVVGDQLEKLQHSSFQELLQSTLSTFHHVIAPDHFAAIFFTSGSTGIPKGVIHTQKSMWAMAENMATFFDMTEDDRFLVMEAISNASGCTHAMLSLLRGGTAILMQGFTMDRFIYHLHHFHPTELCIMGKANFEIIHEPRLTRADFQGIKMNVTGGDKIPPELLIAFAQKTSIPIYLAYGMTEVLCITINKSQNLIKMGSIGIPTKGVEIRLCDEQGNSVPDGTVGEAWVRGENVTAGYWQDPQDTQRALVNDWLRTGDLLWRDTEGFYWFYSRIKYLIIREGQNISPLEIEKVLMQHPAILDACVVGVAEIGVGEVPIAFVELKKGMQCTTDELLQFMVTRLEDFKLPTKISILRELPRNKNGKVDRVSLKKLF